MDNWNAGMVAEGASLWLPLTVKFGWREIAGLNPDGTVYANWEYIDRLCAAYPLDAAKPIGLDQDNNAAIAFAHFMTALRDGRASPSATPERLDGKHSFLWAQALAISVPLSHEAVAAMEAG